MFASIGSHVDENEKYIFVKNSNFFFQKFKKKIDFFEISERMAQGKPQLKFERNPNIKFRDNCDTDGRTTDDGRTDVRTTDDG